MHQGKDGEEGGCFMKHKKEETETVTERWRSTHSFFPVETDFRGLTRCRSNRRERLHGLQNHSNPLFLILKV